MKKKYIILIFMLLSTSMLFSQVEKGKWLLAGSSNLSLDIGKEKWEASGDDGMVSEYKYTEFNFSPQAGYFVIDKLAVGLFMDYQYYKDVATDDDDTWKTTTFVIGPFAQYYIMEYKKLWPYVSAGFGFGSGKSTWNDSDEDKYKISAFRVGGGATYFLNDNIGLDLFLGYNREVDKYEDTGEGYKSTSSSDTYDDIYGSFKMGLGIVVTFGK